MPDSTSEQVMKAFLAALTAAAPSGAVVARNETVPLRVPAGGWICLRDGDPGDPEYLLSPPLYVYEHVAEVDVVIDLAGAAARDALFDTLKQAVGAATAADRTLGGLCDYVLGLAPVTVELGVEGAEDMKAATIGVMLTYGSSDPLA
ncbi:MAG: acyl-CoA transferase [Rhodobacteraceae bacterium]|nr:acyl-CoA transferase [Paracoccaceae bacterium]